MLNENEFYLTLVRHGQSTVNAEPDLMGQDANTPLSEHGILQAQYLRARLDEEDKVIDYVFSSPYLRALRTAEIAMESRPLLSIRLASALREYDAGDWNGASRHSTLTLPIKAKMAAMGQGFLPPNGESLHQTERRSSEWIEENILYNKVLAEIAVKRRVAGEPPLNIYCFSHGMTIKTLLHYVMGFDQNFTWKVMIENTSMTKLYFGPDGWKLFGINDHAHLFSLRA
jgi:broad specificity phosphatase PhoE